MSVAKYMYDIFNVIKNEYVARNVSLTDVVETIGIPKGYVSMYCKDNSVFQERYKIEKSHRSEAASPINNISSDQEVAVPMPQYWIDGWNGVRTAAKLLKTGHGRIVNKHGRKYVEVKL